MKKTVSGILVIILLVSLCACVKKPANDGKPVVYASFHAVYELAKSIGGDKIDLFVLVPQGAEPHDFEPTAADMALIENADLFIYSGMGMEGFITPLKNATADKTVFTDTSIGIRALKNEEATDPHIWLDPINAKAQCREIKEALRKIDPDNADFYETNYKNMASELENLDTAYKNAGIAGKTIVVAHSAYAYLCSAYGLEQVALEGASYESEPTAARIAEIVDFINNNEIKVIYTDISGSTKAVETAVAETGAEIRTLTSFENGVTPYLDAMRANLEALTK